MRIGGTKAGKGAPVVAVSRDIPADRLALPADLQPLDPGARDGQSAAVLATLDNIRKIQTETRDRHGRIRKAKFKAAVLALRWEHFSPKQTAEILGVSQSAVEQALMSLRKDASLDDQIKRIDELVIPIAVDNLARGVIAGDKEYTLRALDGRGVLRSFKSLESNVKKTNLTLRVDVSLPAHHQNTFPTVKPGKVFGVPKRDGGALTSEAAAPTSADRGHGVRSLTAPMAAPKPVDGRVIATPDTL